MCKDVIEISQIEIVPIPPQNGLVGFASFILNNSIYIGCVAIYTSPSSPTGFRLVYPQKMGVSCCHPVNRETSELIQKKVTDRYLNLIKKLTESEDELSERQHR